MNERELLQSLYNFIVTKQIVQGDVDSLKDMAQRYKHPPASMAYPVVIRMTVPDSHVLNDLLSKVEILVASTEVTPLSTPTVPPQTGEANEP